MGHHRLCFDRGIVQTVKDEGEWDDKNGDFGDKIHMKCVNCKVEGKAKGRKKVNSSESKTKALHNRIQDPSLTEHVNIRELVGTYDTKEV